MNNNSNSENLFTEINRIANEAIASYHIKPKAKPYVEQLNFLRSDLPKNHSVRDLFDKLVNHVDAASGQVRDKEHRLNFVSQDLILLEWEFKRLNLLPDAQNA